MEPIATDRGEPEAVRVAATEVLGQVRDMAMFLVDRRGRAASWNRGVGEILGWDEADWLGQPVHVAFTPEEIAAGTPERELREAAANGRADDDRWMQRRDGTRFFALGSVTRLLDAHGRLVGFLKVMRDFTAARRLEEERERLLASERSACTEAERQAAALTAAIEAMPAGVYIGTEDGILRCNAEALAQLGVRSAAELAAPPDELGRRFRVRRERDGPPLDPQELPFVRALRGETAMLETWVTRPGTGEDVYIRGNAAPIRIDGRVVGAVAVNSDLTDRVQLEQKQRELAHARGALRERDERLRALVEGVRDCAIFSVDAAGTIASWHQGAALMLGWSAEEAVGMPFAALYAAEDRAAGRPQQELAEAARRGEFKGEGVRVRKDGSPIEADVLLSALRGAHGEPLGHLALLQDVSERKRREREREDVLRIAQAARAEAERTSRSKGEFLATISHELRTPLGAILGWAHLLERGISDPRAVKQGLAAITRNARVQVQLIEDLLDMNRIESGQLRLEMQTVEPAGVIAGAIDAVLPSAEAKGIKLRTLLDPAAGAVSGDAGRLQQIVWNLLSNAVKFTPEGGHVTVSLARAGDAVEIAVADTGQGIEPGFLGRVFDRFQQQDATTTRRFGGLGLGLAIVKQLAQLHGGSVRAASPGAGQGATVTVSLPAPEARLPSAAAAAAAAAPTRERDDSRLAGVTVLLIDDEPDARVMAEQVLRSAGAEVLAAGSAKEGFALFREHRPQAILSDIGMPMHDGYELMHWVRSLEPDEGGQTPAAAFTAYSRPEDRRRALAVGYQAHLVKPVEPAELIAAVATLAASATDH